MKYVIVLLISLSMSGALWAEDQSIILYVPGMSCSLCTITIKKSLEKVDGVKSVKVTYESKTAEVTFDDKLTDITKLKRATKNAGYPSQMQKVVKQ